MNREASSDLKYMQLVKFYLLFTILFANLSYAQTTGTQFAPNQTHWSEMGCYRVGSFPGPVFQCLYKNILIAGDTVIGSKYCQKMYTSSSHGFDTTCMQFFGYLYYYNERLYSDTSEAIDTSSVLLYDFNLTASDTFNLYVSDTVGCNGHHGYYKMPVDYCDSMFYGNRWRKRIVFEDMPGFEFGGPVKWVDGIGDIDHGLSSDLYSPAGWGYGFYDGIRNFYGALDHVYCNSTAEALNCFQEQGYATYGSNCTVSSCLTAEDEILNNLYLQLFPNPASEIIKVLADGPKSYTIRITDLYGKEYMSEISRDGEIDVRNLTNGMYFLYIQTEGKFTVKKIVVKH